MTTILLHNAPVRGANWPRGEFATVFTVLADAIAYGKSPEAAEEFAARVREHGHEVAGTIYTGGTLIGDRRLAAQIAAQKAADWEAATVLADGDMVQIDGADFKVRFNRGNHDAPRNSDPIRFIPI